MIGKCYHFDCTNRNSFGYCNTIACINPNYYTEDWIIGTNNKSSSYTIAGEKKEKNMSDFGVKVNMSTIDELREFIYSHDVKDVRTLLFCARPNEKQEEREYTYVVHCRDCKWHNNPDVTCWCKYVDTDDDDYCSQGEKDAQIY